MINIDTSILYKVSMSNDGVAWLFADVYLLMNSSKNASFSSTDRSLLSFMANAEDITSEKVL